MSRPAWPLGAVFGALALPAVTVALHWFIARGAFRDGSYVFILAVALAAGAVLGSLTAQTLAHWTSGKPGPAGWTASTGGALTLLTLTLLGFNLGTQDGWYVRLWNAVFWLGLPALWSLCLIRFGSWLLHRAPE
jgi:hypothetical protein